jgi:hypothetical protein
MRSGTDRKKLCKALDDAEQQCENVIVQRSSGLIDHASKNWNAVLHFILQSKCAR